MGDMAYTEAPLAEWLDPPWRYDMEVPSAAKFTPGKPRMLDASELGLIGRYTIEKPPAEISVWGMEVTREVDVADWVDELPLFAEKSLAPIPEGRTKRPGAEADLEAAWEERLSRRSGRVYVTRVGQRLFVVFGSSTRRGYEQMEAFERAVTSFSPKETAGQPFAEGMHEFRAETPMPWRVALPSSWVLMPSASSETASGFQARNMKDNEGARANMVGHASLCVAAREAAKTPEEAAKWYLDELEWAGLVFEAPTPIVERTRKPFKKAWRGSAELSFDAYAGELRYRVLFHEKAWVVAGVVGVTRGEDALSWMQNKRALDILTRSVSLSI